MAAYISPIENLSQFNSTVFKPTNLTQIQASSLYLGRVENPTSTAPSTSFIGGDLFIGGARFGLGDKNWINRIVSK